VSLIPLIKRKLHNLVSDEKFSEILTGSIWALGARVLATGFALLSSIIVARVYGADMMGIVAVINSFVTLSTIFTLLGTNTAILRLIPEHISRYSVSSAHRIYKKTQYFVTATSLVTGATLIALAPLLAQKVFSKPHLTPYLTLAAAFIWARSLMDLNTQAVRGLRLLRTFAFMHLCPQLALLALLVAATLWYRRDDSPVCAQLGAWTLTALISLAVITRAFRSRIRPYDYLSPTPLRVIIAIAAPMLVSAAMMYLVGQTGVIILGIFRPDTEVGYYSAAMRLANITTFVFQAINSMTAPKFSELYHAGRIPDLLHIARKSSKLISWTTFPILATLALLGRPILSLLYGQPFCAGYPALLLLTIGQFVNSASGSTGMFMNMTGHQSILRNIMLASAGLNILMNFLLVPRFSLLGSAAASMVSISMWNIAVLHYIKKKFGKNVGYFPFLPTPRRRNG